MKIGRFLLVALVSFALALIAAVAQAAGSIEVKVSHENAKGEIHINGRLTGRQAPDVVSVDVGDVVMVSYDVGNGAWVVQGSEKFIKFRREEFDDGYMLFADTGSGEKFIGYNFDESVTQSRFDELVRSAQSIRVVVAPHCKNLKSLEALRGRPELWTLDIPYTELSDLSPIKNSDDLRWLDVSATRFSDTSQLGSFPDLRVLKVRSTSIRNLGPVAKLENLVYLSMQSCSYITDISPLASLRGLESLFLSNTPVADLSPLVNLRNLKELTLRGVRVDDLSPLASVKGLKFLGISFLLVAGGEIERLKENLPDVVIIDQPPAGASTLDKKDASSIKTVRVYGAGSVSRNGVESMASSSLTIGITSEDMAGSGVSSGKGFLVKRGDILISEDPEVFGALIVRGDERTIAFENEPFEYGLELYVETGSGSRMVGYRLKYRLPQELFDAAVRKAPPIGILMASWSEDIESIDSLADKRGIWYLDLNRTKVDDLTALSYLKNLQFLDVSHTEVNDLTPLRGLADLRILRASGCPLEDISPLAGLDKLVVVGISGVKITDISALKNKEDLEYLSINSTKVSDISPLAGSTKLRMLWLVKSPVSDISALARMINLEDLDLSRTDVSDISPLANLKKLVYLNLSWTKVTDVTPLANLKNLSHLNLNGCMVYNIKPLANLKSLQVLKLGTPASDEDVEWLKTQLPKCRIDH